VNALSKAIIADALSSEIKLSKPDAKQMVEDFFEEIRFALENGEHVKLSGYGNFTLRDKPQRPGRNPKTGEEIPVEARRVVTFKPGLKLKTKIESRGKKD
jgi:integration host factor subunit alpha